VDIERVDDLLTSVAAEELMPRFGRLSAADVSVKTSPFDVVTTADRETEKAISAAARELWPGAVVVGEETAEAGPALQEQLAAERALVVDPLDGTKNFSSGLPLFAVMAAVMRRGRIVAGAIHDPVSRTSALAAEASGAWIRQRGAATTRLRVAEAVPLGEMEAIAGTRFVPEPWRGALTTNLTKLGGHTWFRCAGHEYRLAAAGHVHVLCYHRLMPWDHAAGWLLHREAGGFSAHFDGTPFSPGRMGGGLLCAPDEDSWQRARDGLLGPAATQLP
jgi:fructose-1,6-bisphosphatase/inositol monophosphatase family enzyme